MDRRLGLTPHPGPLPIEGGGGASNVSGPGNRHRRAHRGSWGQAEEFNDTKDAAMAQRMTARVPRDSLSPTGAGVRGEVGSKAFFANNRAATQRF